MIAVLISVSIANNLDLVKISLLLLLMLLIRVINLDIRNNFSSRVVAHTVNSEIIDETFGLCIFKNACIRKIMSRQCMYVF